MAGDAVGLACVTDPNVVEGMQLFVIGYRASEALDPALLHPWAELTDAALVVREASAVVQ